MDQMMVYAQITFDTHSNSFIGRHKIYANTVFFCHNFISNIFNLKMFSYNLHLAESFSSQILIVKPLAAKSGSIQRS